jgi:hypothetical protein
MTRPADAVEDYLDRLFDKLAGTGGTGRRALTEAEDHLVSARAELVDAGVPTGEAATRVVSRFGEADRIAADLRAARRDLPGLARQLVSGGWLLGAVGLIAIGLSGLLAGLMDLLWGARFVAGDAAGITYTASRCADFQEYFPGHGCTTAAALHHVTEVVDDRAAAGVLGLVALVAYVAVRRHGPLAGARFAPRMDVVALVAMTLFGLGAVVLGGPSLVQVVLGDTNGTGAFLSAGIVAGLVAVAAAAYGFRVRLAR